MEVEDDPCDETLFFYNASLAVGAGPAPPAPPARLLAAGCRGCGNRDADKFEIEDDSPPQYQTSGGGYTDYFASDRCICRVCGAINQHISGHDLSNFPVDPEVLARRREARAGRHGYQAFMDHGGYLGTYERQAHFSERLAQARLLEPEVPLRRRLIILEEHERHAGRQPLEGRCLLVHTTRASINEALHRLDARRADQFSSWTMKYLEKWRSLRAWMCGLAPEEGAAFSFNNAIAIGTLCTMMSNVWNKWNPPDKRLFRSECRFPERSHFPSYNATFRAIFKVLEIPYVPEEWPMPSSEKNVRLLNNYLSQLFAAINLRFIPFERRKDPATNKIFVI